MPSQPQVEHIPNSWKADVHKAWMLNNKQGAIQAIFQTLNEYNQCNTLPPKALFLQLCYYLFQIKDYASASTILKEALIKYPEDIDLIGNLAVCLARNNLHEESIPYAEAMTQQKPNDYTAWDVLSKAYAKTNRLELASKAGTQSLTIKDNYTKPANKHWQLPDISKDRHTLDKKKVISFSLWGDEKRYLYGTLRNLLLAPDIYPDWELRFYMDQSVPVAFRRLVEQLGGKVLLQEDNLPIKDRLCWRFQVSDDSDVGYFLVRDTDSVFSVREYLAVKEWMDSDQWFHIIRDWWTHTDLILAGLWGGVAGVLPNTQTLLKEYVPTHVVTANIDQWFLRDCVWQYIKTSCTIHDRCFKQKGSQPIPAPTPKGTIHIGSCEYHQHPGFQEQWLAAWIKVYF